MKPLKNKLKQAMEQISTTMFLCMMFTMPVLANGNNNTDTSKITQPIDNLANLLIAVIAAVGVIILAKGIFETASAYNQQDNAGVSQGMKGVVSGILMISVSGIIKIMGL